MAAREMVDLLLELSGVDVGKTEPHLVRSLPCATLTLEVAQGPDLGRSLVSRSDVVTIGSGAGNDLQLSDPTVSRHHLELRIVAGRVLVEDCGSTNGTRAAGVSVERGWVEPGTTLELGKTALRVGRGPPVEQEILESDRLGGVIGRTAGMRRLMATALRAAQSEASILLVGETGTGKEVLARAIHEAGARAARPFETVDCAALMATLVASELFGHEKGAFTGADQRHEGAFERADGGTLFLDEIGELPPPLQATLLGALERRAFRRVGGSKPINVDVRIIAATHRDLRAQVNTGLFRDDLYYRLAVVTLRIPPLRERADDLPLLIEEFIKEAGNVGPIDALISRQTVDELRKHSWPGNVRELRNFVEAVLAIGEAPSLGAPTGSGDLHLELGPLEDGPYADAREAVVRTFEKRYLARLLERTGGNVAMAAREAKMDRSYLTLLLKRHELKSRG